MSELPAAQRRLPILHRAGVAPLIVFLVVSTAGVGAVAVARPVFMNSVATGLSDEYDEIALNIAQYGAYSASSGDPTRETVMRGPVYPLYLAALFRLTGDRSLRVVSFTDMVCHGASAALITLALMTWVGPGAAIFGGLLFAFWPTSFYYAGKGSSETMLTLWMVVSFVLLLRIVRAPTRTAALGLGVAIGLACLTRGSGVVMLAVACAWLGVEVLRRRVGPGVVVVLVVAWAVTMSPWWVRNYRVSGAFVPFHSLVWYNAYHDDRYDQAHDWLARTGRDRVDFASVPDDSFPPEVIREPAGFVYPAGLDARGDLAQEAKYRTIMLEKFRSPSYLVRKMARNAVDFWSASASVLKTRVLLASSALWLLLLAWGTWRAWPERRWRGPLLACHAIVWVTWGLYLPFFAIFRHSVPIAPFVAFTIALGLARVARAGA